MNTTQFLGLDFAPVTLNDQQQLDSILKGHPQKLCIYTFPNLVAWQAVHSYKWCLFTPDTLLLSIQVNGQEHLLQPEGSFTEKDQQELLEILRHQPQPVNIYRVPNQFLKQQPAFCSHFTDTIDPSRANYLYRTKDLATLAGRNYDKKRNLISQFERQYTWTAAPLTKNCGPHCIKILLEIANKKPVENSATLEGELKALEFMMTHFEQLNQKGCLLSIDGKPVAFSIYEALNPTTAVIHFEKADREFKGVYQMINRETAKMIANDGLEFINREEDLGVSGLHQAKMSYHPISLETAHLLTFKCDH